MGENREDEKENAEILDSLLIGFLLLFLEVSVLGYLISVLVPFSGSRNLGFLATRNSQLGSYRLSITISRNLDFCKGGKT
ncbi:hypothetical protein AT15_06415 [Kosmotoga arenicorallina S304]|uniref:Uncharacterized protein n=1 Tax=Kosmotoga arenicorallina S304 TaxID=1453497 RepID=A0A176JTJ5_9BACT|nr:hypothetical protein AT15_06415 [Kosmotoga arenicorallina S304]